MVNTFAVIAATRDSQSVAHSAPPSTFEILLWLPTFLLLVWLSITGRLAESVHRSWKDTWILPGIMSDVPTLKKILPLIRDCYASADFGYVHSRLSSLLP